MKYVSRWIGQKIKIRCLSKITMSRKPGSSTRRFLAWKRASDVFFSLKFKRSIRVSTWQKGCVVSLWLGTFGGLLPRTLSYLAVKSAVAVMSLIIVEEKKLLETIMIINFSTTVTQTLVDGGRMPSTWHVSIYKKIGCHRCLATSSQTAAPGR
jgi:hypothetical protein